MLEAVAGHHPVVVVRGDEEQGGVLNQNRLSKYGNSVHVFSHLTIGGLGDVVQGGDASEVGEALGLVTAAVVADPGVAHSELLESEQVHHPGRRYHYYRLDL